MRILKSILPGFIKKIYYGRLKSKNTVYDKSFYCDKMFRGWAKRYSHFHDLRCEVMARHVTSGICLDIGSGNGQLLEKIDSKGVIGSDIVIESLLETSRKLPEVPFLCFNIDYLPLRPTCLECITMGEVLEHMHSPEKILENIYNIIKPGGRLILSVPTKYGLFGIVYDGIWTWLRGGYNSEGHLQRFSYKTLKSLIEKVGFTIQAFENFCFLGFFLKNPRIIDIDYYIAKFLSKNMANHWIVVATKE